MKYKVVLTNNFHNTTCAVYAREINSRLYISYRQARAAWKKLCGIPSCTCGDTAGARPQQTEPVTAHDLEIIER